MALNLIPKYRAGTVDLVDPTGALTLQLELIPFFIGNPGPEGPPGDPGPQGQSYEHSQSVAAATWTVDHNLGHRPVVQVFDLTWVEIIAAVENVTINQTIITFNSARAGFALCY